MRGKPHPLACVAQKAFLTDSFDHIFLVESQLRNEFALHPSDAGLASNTMWSSGKICKVRMAVTLSCLA